MTDKEFEMVVPRKTIINVHTNEGDKKMLVKFFLCNRDNFDGYWMCCTEDLSNPYPVKRMEDDWNVYANNADIISY